MEKNKIKLISFITFLNGFSQSVVVYVLSTFFEKSSGTVNVGIFYALAYSLALITFLNLHKVVKKIGKARTFLFLVLLKIGALAFLIFLGISKLSVLGAIFYLFSTAAEWTMLDVILESFSTDRASGRIRGWHLTIYNTGFLFGPFLAVKLLERFDFSGIFALAFFLSSLILIISLWGLREVNQAFSKKLGVKELFLKIWRRKNLVRIYCISFVLEAFFALMVIYVPLYLVNSLDFSWSQIGKVFTVMLIPFVILQYPMGFLADKKFGEKEFIIFSLVLMGISTLGVYFVSSRSLLVWSTVLFATRIGAAIIEVLRDSYFYKQIDGRDVDIIDFFRTAMPAGYIFSTTLSSLVLIFFSLKATFILVTFLIFLALYPAFGLRDSSGEGEAWKKLKS